MQEKTSLQDLHRFIVGYAPCVYDDILFMLVYTYLAPIIHV